VPILIDGHNLIGRLATLSLQDPDDEEKLLRLLRSYQARTGKAITVVFDPGGQFVPPRTRRLGAIEVVFAPQGSEADRVIVRRVRQSRDPRGWLVVTSDRRLAEQVVGQGARVQSAEAFAEELGRPGETEVDWKDAPPSPDEVKAWLTLFDGRDGQDALGCID
jgi:predicted RNA-binding protein with PIN domain